MSCTRLEFFYLRKCLTSSFVCFPVAILDAATSVYKYRRNFGSLGDDSQKIQPKFSYAPNILASDNTYNISENLCCKPFCTLLDMLDSRKFYSQLN